jgi:hypothetical protein
MPRVFPLFVSLALTAPATWAAGAQTAPTADQVRVEVRRAVEAHRAQQRDDIRRQEAEVGRRLTAAERAELREQVRYQWLLPSSTPSTPKPPVVSSPERPPGAASSGAGFTPSTLRR